MPAPSAESQHPSQKASTHRRKQAPNTESQHPEAWPASREKCKTEPWYRWYIEMVDMIPSLAAIAQWVKQWATCSPQP